MTKCKVANLRKLKENPLVLGWQLETLHCTSQLYASEGQRFQGSLCSRAVGNGVFLAASDSPSPLLAVAEMGQAISMWRVQWQRHPALLMLHSSKHLRPLHTTDWALLLYPQTLILPTHSSLPPTQPHKAQLLRKNLNDTSKKKKKYPC